MKLIDEGRQAWRLWSVRVLALGSAIYALLLAAPDQVLALWQALPVGVQTLVPNAEQFGLGLSVAATIARLIRQRSHADV